MRQTRRRDAECGAVSRDTRAAKPRLGSARQQRTRDAQFSCARAWREIHRAATCTEKSAAAAALQLLRRTAEQACSHRRLNRDDLPTLGRPTTPIFKLLRTRLRAEAQQRKRSERLPAGRTRSARSLFPPRPPSWAAWLRRCPCGRGASGDRRGRGGDLSIDTRFSQRVRPCGMPWLLRVCCASLCGPLRPLFCLLLSAALDADQCSTFTGGAAAADADGGAGEDQPDAAAAGIGGAAGFSALTAAGGVSVLMPEMGATKPGGSELSRSMRCGGRRLYGGGSGAAGALGLTASGDLTPRKGTRLRGGSDGGGAAARRFDGDDAMSDGATVPAAPAPPAAC